MKYDRFGRSYTDCDELVNLLYCEPELDLTKFLVLDHEQYNHSVKSFYADFPLLEKFVEILFAQWHAFDLDDQIKWHDY